MMFQNRRVIILNNCDLNKKKIIEQPYHEHYLRVSPSKKKYICCACNF